MDLTENQVSLKYNEALAAEYLSCFKKMEEKFSLENDIRVSALSRYPEVITMEEQAIDDISVFRSIPTLETSRSFALDRIVLASRFISWAIKSSFLPTPASPDFEAGARRGGEAVCGDEGRRGGESEGRYCRQA